MYAIFGMFDRLTGAISDRIRDAWSWLWEGPLQFFLFYLILSYTLLKVGLRWLYRQLDRGTAWLESAFVTVALLAMVGLSFLDYLRREVSIGALEVEGGPNMAMVLLVWVGFIGASLATRRRRHLAVDSSDRILSPGAARWVKRFSSVVAAGLCWKLAQLSWLLTAEGLEFEDSLEGLTLWESLAGPLNTLIQFLPGPDSKASSLLWASLVGIVVLGWAWDQRPRSGVAAQGLRWLLQALNGVLSGLFLLALLSQYWEPVNEFGDPLSWPTLEAGSRFPLWLAEGILPLSFLVMAFRFLGLAIRGEFEPLQIEGAEELNTWTPPAPARGGDRSRRDVVLAGLIPGLLLGMGAALYFGKGALIFVAAFALVLVGAPLFTAVGIAALACVMLISGLSGLSVATDMFEACKKQELLAIPFFVLAGNIMTQGSLAQRLIGIARAFMGTLPGGLGLATIFACVIFAAISGSSPVTVIAIGSILFPMLIKDRYPENYSLGVLSSAGSLGIIIPPSVPMIVYAIMVTTPQRVISPIDLFLAGVLPGLFIAGVLVIYTLYRTRPGALDEEIVMPVMEGGYFPNLGRELRRGFMAMLLPILILGGIYGLLGPLRFTVNEAAAVAVVYALFVELVIHRDLRLNQLPKIVTDSAVMMGGLFLIIVLAIAFNKFLTHEQVPQAAATWLASHVDTQWQFIILVNIFLLLLGCVMEILSAILIVAPLLAPIADQFGMDPIHFGILFIVNLELGYLTPPMGINLFVASTVFNRPIVQVIKASLPFLFLMLLCLMVISWFPSLSLFLLDR